jgi:hypothetical protein
MEDKESELYNKLMAMARKTYSVPYASMRSMAGPDDEAPAKYPKISKDIYQLDLYETALIEVHQSFYINVIRVPGGWLHKVKEDTVFVPYSDDFRSKFAADKFGI